jgi:hypothetical protein
MSTLADFEFNTARLSAGVIKVTESVRFDFNAEDVRRQLQLLVDEARHFKSSKMSKLAISASK